MDEKTYSKGFILCFENAKRLFGSAEILEKQKEFAVANSLLILSAEEAIKAFIVLTQHAFPDKILEGFEKSFEDHKHKLETIRGFVAIAQIMQKMGDTIYSPALENLIAGKSKEEVEQGKWDGVNEMVKWFQDVNNNKQNYLSQQDEWWKHAQTMKESGFYVNFNKGKWTSPTSFKKQSYIKTKKYVEAFITQVETLYNYSLDEDFVKEIMDTLKKKLKEFEIKKRT